MDIHLNAHVDCTDGRIGRLENVIVNTHAQKVTYLVVKEHDVENTLRLVSEKKVKEATHDTVTLSISKEKFREMKHFIQEDYIPSNVMLYMAEQEGWYAGIPAGVFVEHEDIPAGGVAVHKGAKVFAGDERVGRVDEFLVEGKSGRITHLVLLEGHLWGKKDIAVPVDQIDRYENGDVYLKMNKDQVESLPEFDVKEHDR